MGLRFRKSFKIAPGLRVNLGSRGFTSISVGRRGATMNFGKRGTTGTVSLPGTGLSYQHRFKNLVKHTPHMLGGPAVQGNATSSSLSLRSVAYIVIALVLVGSYLVAQGQSGGVVAPVRSAITTSSVTPSSAEPPPMVPSPTDVTTMNENAADKVSAVAVTPAVSRSPIKNTVSAAQAANVRTAPSITGTVVRVLPKGASVQILERENGWLYVADPDGTAIGWVHSSLLK